MSFGSMVFLFGFLPAVLVCYFLLPARWRTGRNTVLLLFSLAFYCWGGVRLLPALAGVLRGQLGGGAAGRRRDTGAARRSTALPWRATW